MNYDYEYNIRNILRNLPHKLVAQYTMSCIDDIKHLLKDLSSLKALEVVELWLEGNATLKEIEKAADDAWDSYNTISRPDDIKNAAYSVYYFIDEIIDYSCDDSVHPIYYVSLALNVDMEVYYDRLIKFVNKLTSTEKIIYNIQQ